MENGFMDEGMGLLVLLLLGLLSSWGLVAQMGTSAWSTPCALSNRDPVCHILESPIFQFSILSIYLKYS